MRFFSEFPGINGEYYRLRIFDEFYSGEQTEVELEEPGFTLTYDGDNNTLSSPIIASKCTIPIIATATTLPILNSFLSDVSASAETRFWVVIDFKPNINASWSRFWFGYLLPDFYIIEDLDAPSVITLSAADNIGRLKAIEYRSGSYPYGLISCLSHIINCLTADGLANKVFSGTEVFLTTAINWLDSNIGFSISKCPLAFSFIQGSLFAEKIDSDNTNEQFKFETCYEVLESILFHWGARIYLDEGVYRIDQIGTRASDFYYIRRFNRSGGLVSSGFVTSDFTVAGQNPNSGARLSNGTFTYLPPLRRAIAIYEHSGANNYLDGYGHYWYVNSPFLSTPAQISNIALDNVACKLSFRLIVSAKLNAVYTAPWRVRIRLSLVVGTHSLYGTSQNLVVNGNPTTTILPTIGQWLGSTSNFFEISSSFCFTEDLYEEIDVVIETPNITHTGGAFVNVLVNFSFGDSLDMFSNPVVLDNTATYWQVANPDLRFIVGNTNITIEKGKVRYSVVNPNSFNSEVLEGNFKFGAKAVDWSKTTLFTNSAVTPTTDTWGVGAPGALAFNQLWAQEMVAWRRYPREIYEGSLYKKGIRFGQRIIFSDTRAWLFLRGSYAARDGIWTCSLVRAGADRVGLTADPPISLPPGGIYERRLLRPGGVLPDAASLSFDGPANLAIIAQTVNLINNTINAGTISSLPLRYAVNALDYVQGDDILVVNPTNGNVIPFEVATTSADGDTSLAVVPKAVPKIPAGALLLYGPLNKYTKQGGAHADLPQGTFPGQVLRWNNSAKRWEAFSGSAAGHVLTWNASTGWQSQAPASGGVQGSGLANYVAIWVAADQITYDPSLYFDMAANNLGVNTASPAARIHSFFGTTSGQQTALLGQGTVSGALQVWIDNSANTSTADAVLHLRVNSQTSNDPFILYNIGNATYWSEGMDNSDGDKFKISPSSALGAAESVFVLTRDTPMRCGINVNSPAYQLDVNEGIRGNRFIGRLSPPTITPGTGMGTAPTGITTTGSINGFQISFTTGSAPAANATIFTATYGQTFPTGSVVVFSPRNSTTASQTTRFFVSANTTTGFTFTSNGALDANTTYTFSFVIMGW